MQYRTVNTQRWKGFLYHPTQLRLDRCSVKHPLPPRQPLRIRPLGVSLVLKGSSVPGISKSHVLFQYFWSNSQKYWLMGLLSWLNGKESACQCRRHRFDSWVGKIPWRRKWLPTPVFLPGEFHGQRSLVGYSPWGHKRVRYNLGTKW